MAGGQSTEKDTPPPSLSTAASKPPPNLVPPPENAQRYDRLHRHKNRRSCCCCFILCLLFFLIVAAAVLIILYLVFGFKSPLYTLTNVSVKGLNLTWAAPISPRFDVCIRVDNPNRMAGICYLKHGAVDVFYGGVRLADGVLPDFYQPRRNATVMQTALIGTDVVLDGAVKTALRCAQSRGKVPLVVNVKAPVRFKVGSVKTWEINVKVKCDVVLDLLNDDETKIVSKDCDRGGKIIDLLLHLSN